MKFVTYIAFICVVAFVSCQKELAPLPEDDDDPVEIPDTTHPPTLLRTMINGDSALVQLPFGYDKNKKYALLLAFAGGAKSAQVNLDDVNGVAVKLRKGLTLDTSLIVICPQNETAIFKPNEINRLLDSAVKRYAVDTQRLYLTGFKTGAYNILNYLSDDPKNAERIAAATPIACFPLDKANIDRLYYAAKTKVMLYCGRHTKLFSDNKLYAQNMQAEFIPYNDNRISYLKIYSPNNRFFHPDIYQSMLQYKK